MRQIIGCDVRPEMMHADQRQAVCRRKALGKIDSHQQRADQPRRKGDGHAIQLTRCHSRLIQRPLHHRTDIFGVAAGCDFRHDSAVFFVFLHLRRQNIGADFPSVLHHRRTGIVARGFNCQNSHNNRPLFAFFDVPTHFSCIRLPASETFSRKDRYSASAHHGYPLLQ